MHSEPIPDYLKSLDIVCAELYNTYTFLYQSHFSVVLNDGDLKRNLQCIVGRSKSQPASPNLQLAIFSPNQQNAGIAGCGENTGI